MNLPVPNLIVQLVEQHTDILSINLFRPKLSPPIQDNPSLSRNDLQLVNEALALRAETGFPFWDCLLQIVSRSEIETENVLNIVQRHNAQGESLEKVVRDQVRIDVIRGLMADMPPDEVLAISSKTECSGSRRLHVPMLDFHCKISSFNDKRVKMIVRSMQLHGYIVHSGQSYHFYGSNLLTTDELMIMLAKALLFAPIVDRAWVAHQLIERACGLRISPGKTYRETPMVIEQL